MTILEAKNFNNRQDLEKKVSSLMGLTAENKPDYVIKGTNQEFKKLNLGHAKIFWGIKCEQTDLETPKALKTINRGKIYKSELKSMNIKDSEER